MSVLPDIGPEIGSTLLTTGAGVGVGEGDADGDGDGEGAGRYVNFFVFASLEPPAVVTTTATDSGAG